MIDQYKTKKDGLDPQLVDLEIAYLDHGASVYDRRELQKHEQSKIEILSNFFDVALFKTRFNLEDTEQLLAKPVTKCKNILSPESEAFLAKQLNAEDRFNVLIADKSAVRYDGTWYSQGWDGTCQAWAIVNACSVKGVDIDPNLLTALINKAIVIKANYKQAGLNMFVVEQTIAEVDSSNISIVQVEDRLESTRPPKKTVGAPDFTFKYNLDLSILEERSTHIAPCFSDREIASIQYKLTPEYRLNHNAEFIKSHLDKGEPLLLYVRPSMFWENTFVNKGHYDGHAIVVSGYEFKNAHMNVQIIDSDLGIYWTSLEHFSYSLEELTHVSLVGKK